MKRYEGLVAAAFTPMHNGGAIAPEKIPAIIDYSVKHKFAGLFVTGSTGEFASLTTDERKIIAETYIRESNGRIPIIIHAGSCSVRESINLAEHAKASGADAVCAIAPFYFRPENVRLLADVLKEIACACNPLPLFYYHAPSCTMTNISMLELLRTVDGEIPNFAGIKFTSEKLMEYQRCVDFSDKYQVLFGKDEMLLGALAMGAKAGIGTNYNFMPRVYNGIIEAYRQGDMKKAAALQAKSQELVELLVKYGFASLKFLMELAGVDVGPVRLPLANMTEDDRKNMSSELEKSGLMEYLG
jgi:N-acetylneuraminate lyase